MKVNFDALVAGIYDAALDFGLWPAILEAASTNFAASHAIVYTPDIAPQAGGFFVSHNVSPEHLAAYEERYRQLDVWTLGYHRMHDGHDGAFTGEMLASSDELLKSEFYADFLRLQRIRHMCNSVVHARPRVGLMVSLAIFRGPQKAGFEEDERLICQRLAPHLQRALVISERLKSCERERRIDSSMLDSVSVAIFLVDASAKILRLTETAERLAKEATHLCVRFNRLCSASQDDRLVDTIRKVARADVSEPFSALIALSSKARPDRIHVLIAKAGMHLRGYAYVVVGPVATARSSKLLTHLRLEYSLTPAEVRLCGMLLRGHSINEAADLLSIKRSTVVSQLKSIFSKTATSRQSDLMRLLIDVSALQDVA